MKTNEKMQVKRANVQYAQPRGGGMFIGCGRGCLFRRGRGQLIYDNCVQLGHYARDCTNLMSMCSYFKALDHTIKDYTQIIVKWKYKTNTIQIHLPNTNKNVKNIKTEPREKHLIVVVINRRCATI